MNVRELDKSELHALNVTGIHPIWTDFDPENHKAVVVEDNGRIVAAMEVVRVVHLECVWVDPEYRNAGVIRRLLRRTVECARKWGQFAMAQTRHENVCDLLLRNGAMPMTDAKSFVLPLYRRAA